MLYMYLLLSWRNLWRNKKRTMIVAASVFFAVVLAVVMRSSQGGSYAYMIHSSARLFTGYAQVQGRGYWENRSLDDSIALADDMSRNITAIPHVTGIAPRLETYTLASYDTTTKVAQIIGINPQSEDAMTGLRRRVTQGDYLTETSDGALVAEGLAQRLRIKLGDSIVLYGQGYHGETAAAQIPVIGLVKMPFQEMNTSLIFLALPQAQSIFSAPGRITSLPLMVDDIRHLPRALDRLHALVSAEYTIMTWDTMMPDLVQNIQLDNASGMIMLIILYIVIGFGVFGTVMMMVSERMREFGILVSVGMKKSRLIIVMTMESIFISLLGVAAGGIVSFPIISYLHRHPIPITGESARVFDSLGIEAIINFSNDPHIFVSQTLVVLLIALLTAIYPLIVIWRIKPVEALHA